jgi:hypothetical protein
MIEWKRNSNSNQGIDLGDYKTLEKKFKRDENIVV